MITSRRFYFAIMIMAASGLTACVVQPASSYYRGTINNEAPQNNDASITANVVAAVHAASGGATNLQVSTLNGVVTLRGTADTQVVAQNDVQAARQVPGVQRVDYDIQVLRR